MLLHVGPLPDNPLEAAAAFHAAVLPRVLNAVDQARHGGTPPNLTLVFPPAGHPHRAWREAAVQTLGRECAPVRINAVAASDEGADRAALAAAAAWLAAAPGVTGQFLTLDSHGAGPVLPSDS